ncbi:hypothetical protein K491DRAFT_587839 [Lophiostoma macrostomum CBS 122681]|uniref:Uncharacterized protein n=1 Tax=Lophiostoma macrostomum CBS 122681 TaxID=1314788 RepID=A0A6A6TPL7_9PLEO|nr:hypothetical protein K491DRAFT_587839 [Lophiostoma macrostomum CBS 122681]
MSRLNSDIPPHLTKTPWELERSKRHSAWRKSKPEPSVLPFVFKKLPREVYDCIVEQLEQIHFREEQSCPSCYLRDLYHLSLTSRAWDRAATIKMYRKCWVLINEEHPKLPKQRVKGTSRLKLLRRTLRERPTIARYVRELHLSEFQTLYRDASIEREEIVNMVASLVMACPNLERLVDFHIPYAHTFDRLSSALSTRRNLKERVWLLGDDASAESEDEEEDPSNIYYHAASDPTERFLELNSEHSKLTTLVMNQAIGQATSPLTFRFLIGTIRQLPSLRDLFISGFSASSFTNMTLNALPANLRSLRLEDLPGVNDKGLQRFAQSSLVTSLKTLTLINMEIFSLTTLSDFLSPNTSDLRYFTISQQKAPILTSDADIPNFQSEKLISIHWELRSQAGPAPVLLPTPSTFQSPQFPFSNSEPIPCLATSLLARNIETGLFPSLRRIRAPHDPQGLLQALCRPRASALLPSDTSLLTSPPRQSLALNPFVQPPIDADKRLSSKYIYITSRPGTARTDSPMASPVTTQFHRHFTSTSKASTSASVSQAISCPPGQSRLQAQSRILHARKQPAILFKVEDPDGVLRINKCIYGFMGKLDSRIEYVVRPDWDRVQHHSDSDAEDDGGGLDGAGAGIGLDWVTGVGDVTAEWEVVSNQVRGCRHAYRGGAGAGSARVSARVEDLF